MYIWELPDWPSLTWDQDQLTPLIGNVRHEQGRLLGRMDALGFNPKLREEATLWTLTQDVVTTSEIEGEKLDPSQVRSSVARRLGMDAAGLPQADRNVEGVVEMMLDATQNYEQPLTKRRLFGWHASLFPTAYSGMRAIRVAKWRDDSAGPMQVVSGPIGREHIHYEAPSADTLNTEMATFLKWLNTKQELDLVVKAAIAHLWFVTIHPFDDGNGRIARAIADMLLARSEGSAQRFYSMSSQIRVERAEYYRVLERTQKGTLEVAGWMKWFFECLGRAIDGAEGTLSSVTAKARFWERLAREPLNERQVRVLNRLLDGFEGKLTTSKWAKLAHCSQDTAYRDILDLMERSILKREPSGGRSTSYSIVGTS